ncbi:MAG: DUF6502 family protein [Pseudomonadota bacterium]
MRTTIQNNILQILLRALQPLVHLLLEAGIGHREFSEISKKAFVKVATDEYGIRGRDTNISRVAVMTGLTRKEVKKIRTSLNAPSDSVDERIRPIPASVVLFAWHSDPDYSDAGEPRTLPFSGDGGSFTSLVKKYAGDIPPGAIRAELRRTGAIEVLESGSVRAVRRGYIPAEGNDRLARALSRPLFGLLLNLGNNNLPGGTSIAGGIGWPEGIVNISGIREADIPRVQELAKIRLENFARSLDDELQAFAIDSETGRGSELSLGVGYYYFEN